MASGISFSLGGKKAPAAKQILSPTPTNGIKRPHAALHDDSDDEDGPQNEAVTHFDTKAGALNAAKPKVEKQALIIRPQANRDWKEASKANKRAKYGLSSDPTRDTATREARIKEIEDANKPTFGLNTFEKKNATEDDGEDETNGHDAVEAEAEETTKLKTDDERAIDALLGKKPGSNLMIAATNDLTEEEAFAKDFRSAPEMATLDEYKAVPVEEFGAALLRGMGWKEGQGIGNQKGKKMEMAKIPERRPALLGIGAKAEAAVADEMGVWGRASKVNGKRQEPKVYNPIVMRNKKTGEELTEQELQEKLKQQKFDDFDKVAADARKDKERQKDKEKDRERRRRQEESDEEYERRRKERKREREREDKYKSSKRERSRSYDRERRKERDYDDRKDKERRSDRNDRDRHRSRRDDDYDSRDRGSRRHRH